MIEQIILLVIIILISIGILFISCFWRINKKNKRFGKWKSEEMVIVLENIEMAKPIERRNSIIDKIEDVYELDKHCDEIMGRVRRHSLYE